MTEQILITKCSQGNRGAQFELYKRYNKAMYTAAYRITGNFEDAGEVLQDAFLQVFRHIGGFEQRSTLGTWIKTIVVRSAIAHLRRRRLVFLELDQQQSDTTVDWGMHGLETDYLERAIMALPEGARSVFVMAEIEGFSHREIATMLEITEGTSKSQLHYAKLKLRESLKKNHHLTNIK
jgi:RNA polymerase sigma factor (sigma-70 family)